MPSSSTTPRLLRVLFLVGVLATVVLIPSARSQEMAVQFDPAQTKIEFTLGATLHTVHGSFQLKSGAIRFDPSAGTVSGTIAIDASSGESGNDGRDKKMHHEILESDKFPEISFTPKHLKGSLASEGPSKLELNGQIRLHGKDHDMTLPLDVVSGGGKLQITTQVIIPYVQWGLKNPSTFVLRVSDKVTVDIRASGRVTSTEAPH